MKIMRFIIFFVAAIAMPSVRVMAQATTPETPKAISQFYLEIPSKKVFSICVPSGTTYFSYLVDVYGETRPDITMALNESIEFEDLPDEADNLRDFTVAVIVEPKFEPDTVLKPEDLLRAKYDADLSCINQPTGCMARTSELRLDQYCMIAANPEAKTKYVYLGCTQDNYTASADLQAEETKLRNGAPDIAEGDPYIPPIGFEPAKNRTEGAKGDGTNLKALIGDDDEEGADETPKDEQPEGEGGSEDNDSASHVHFGSTSFLFILLLAVIFMT